jgi:hypothetical protein
VEKREKIREELALISKTVADIPQKPVFTVPGGYFDDFPALMLSLVRKEDDLAGELASISPLLAGLDRKMPMSVPEGYFNQVPALPEQEKKPETPVFHINTRGRVVQISTRRRMLYLAAAVVVLLGVFTLFYRLGDSTIPQAPLNISEQLPALSTEELNGYLTSSPELMPVEPLSIAGLEEIDFENILDNVNVGELQEFINENPSYQIENIN